MMTSSFPVFNIPAKLYARPQEPIQRIFALSGQGFNLLGLSYNALSLMDDLIV